MSIPSLQSAVSAGEISPDLYGRVDLQKYRTGCSTMRNFYSSYRGGASTRAGTAFVGQCKQGNQGYAESVPAPRNITFAYSVAQGIVIEWGEKYARFVTHGGYILESSKPVTAITRANPGVVTSAAHGYVDGDEVFLTGLPGIPQINSRSFVVSNAMSDTFEIANPLDGVETNTSAFPAYTAGGSVARVYTLATPYAAADVPYLKFTQSADVMSLTCVNQATFAEYPPYDLARIANDHWTLTATAFTSTIRPPASISLSVADSGITTPSFYYSFCATAVDSKTGAESIASPTGVILSVDIAAEAATITINCASVTGASTYNFYVAPATFGAPPSAGALFGYLGSSYGPVFTDSNSVADFTQAPPSHRNPFAVSPITAVPMTSFGTSYSTTATTAVAISPTGDNASLTPVVVGGAIQWVIVNTGGSGYTGGEAVSFVDGTGMGSGAAASLTIGPASGVFPSVVAYFQERRFYASTLNQPDTYFGSQPGSFTNMDVSFPVVPSDAITGTPWSQQVNGIQWMLNMPGGLVIFTGLGAWQVSGAGQGLATSTAITPENQVANPQAYNGCSPTVPPIPINYDILYVQEKGSIVRDLSYNFFVNIYTGTDLTVLSNHLFDGYTIVQWGWAEEPNKLMWVVRNDGIMLCLTYLKEQDVYSWSRHDTNGLFQSVCTVSEPPVNAPYFIVKRLIQNDGNPVWGYFQERMDNRLWVHQEDAWCVDAGLSTTLLQPNAMLSISSATGIPTLSQPAVVFGGHNYSPQTYAVIVDQTGTGAMPSVIVAGGVVTGASVAGNLAGYTQPVFRVIDPTGVGGEAAVSIFVNDLTTVMSSPAVFANVAGQGEVGDVIRMDNRTMEVLQYVSASTLIATVLRDDTQSIPNDPTNTAVPAPSGQWSIASPISTVYGLNHLEGMLVSILADGVVVAPQIVQGGTITLPQPATLVTAGLGFTAQLQTLYLDIPGPATVQGRRKEIDSVVVRISKSGLPFSVGTNQPDAATQPGQVNVPWRNMTPVQSPPPTQQPIQPNSLITGDIFVDILAALAETNGQVAVQQDEPIPVNILALIPWSRIQDDVSAE